jgi:hypothetical protein
MLLDVSIETSRVILVTSRPSTISADISLTGHCKVLLRTPLVLFNNRLLQLCDKSCFYTARIASVWSSIGASRRATNRYLAHHS